MLKFTIIFLVLLNGIGVYCEDCTAPGIAGHWEILLGGSCCRFPNISITTEEAETIMKELKLDAMEDDTLPINNTADCLIVENILTNSKLVADGKLVMTEVTDMINEMFNGSTSFITLATDVVQKCIKDGTAKEAEIKKKASEPPYNISKSCNPLFGYIAACLSVELTLQCPDADKIKSPECDKERDFLKKCPEQYFSMLAST